MTEKVLRQTTAVAIDGRALLLEGPPGCGKSTLALSLIDRGAKLVGDDGVMLSADGGILIAMPAPNTAGLIEVRGVGLIEQPAVNAPVALVLEVSPDAPRYVESPETIELAGLPIPRLLFARYNESDPIRAEAALQMHGRSVSGWRQQ